MLSIEFIPQNIGQHLGLLSPIHTNFLRHDAQSTQTSNAKNLKHLKQKLKRWQELSKAIIPNFGQIPRVSSMLLPPFKSRTANTQSLIQAPL
ncbi:hypothetical protein, partial [Aeromonas veronii]|uniref:hypothetical protein n=1 Tax=Aeromonas veronii TaxID=654 RepID=UPI003D7C4647